VTRLRVVGCSVRNATGPLAVVGDVLHSNVNNRQFKSMEAGRSDIYTVFASFTLYHDVEFDWVGMEVEGLIIN